MRFPKVRDVLKAQVLDIASVSPKAISVLLT